MLKSFLLSGSILAALAVVLGAFGAHGLKHVLSAEQLITFETGVRYQFYHALALLLTGILYDRIPVKWLRFAGHSFITGIILFSGSLYLLALLGINKAVGLKSIGLLTPVGGIFFILGWTLLIAGIIAYKPSIHKSG